MHGCTVDIDHGKTTFHDGLDKYSYDGTNFLAFNEKQENWDARDDGARVTKESWDKVQVLREYTITYLQQECVTWLTRFLKYQKENGTLGMYSRRFAPEISTQQKLSDSAGTEGFSDNVGSCFPAKPDLYVFATGARVPTNMVLKCMATGFSSRNSVLQIKLGGRVLTREDGVDSTDVLPNGDGTFQITHSVEILKSDQSDYTCELSHPPSSLHVRKVWGKNLSLLFMYTHFITAY